MPERGLAGLVGAGLFNHILLLHIVTRRGIHMGVAVKPAYVEQHCHRDGGYQQGYQEPLPGSTQGITHLNSECDIPTIFGVLTVDTEQDALDRAGGSLGNKGAEAAQTALLRC